MRKFVSNVVRFCRDCLEALRDDDEETVRLKQRADARLRQERWLEYLSGWASGIAGNDVLTEVRLYPTPQELRALFSPSRPGFPLPIEAGSTGRHRAQDLHSPPRA